MALELQSRLVIDDEWLTRPGSYARYGVRDVWLWHPQVGVPGIVAEHGQPGWIYAADRHRLTALVGNGAPREQDWWDAADVEAFGPQWPAPPGRRTRQLPFMLRELAVNPTGVAMPEGVVRCWHDELTAAAATARTAGMVESAAVGAATASTEPALLYRGQGQEGGRIPPPSLPARQKSLAH